MRRAQWMGALPAVKQPLALRNAILVGYVAKYVEIPWLYDSFKRRLVGDEFAESVGL